MPIPDRMVQAGQWLVLGLSVVLALWAGLHALVYKRDPRAATLWIGVVWLIPLLGPVLYFLLGVNRIKRWASSLKAGIEAPRAPRPGAVCSPEELARRVGPLSTDVAALARAVERVTGRPLLPGNRVEPLENGDEAYPAMLEAIGQARESVTLATYIFDSDATGREFARVLGAAVRRGVEVRVLVDATGARYSWPTIVHALRREGVPCARFLRLFPVWRLLAMNLRNHRKILVVDGRIGFTGGMNIREGHWLGRSPRRPVRDRHFRLTGPVVAQLQEVFVEDWQFTTRERLQGERWFPALEAAGTAIARGIADGPDEDFDKLKWTLLAALAAARDSIRIATPYFLPGPELIAALNTAAMRGVKVDILLPARSNLPLVQQASRAMWWQVLKHGCRVWLSPPPFDHTKLVVVDDVWTCLGSANWDPRSLRLNFEFNVETYDPLLAGALASGYDRLRAESRLVTLDEVDSRAFPQKVTDGFCRLFTPFL